ncbi:DNA polymerase delta, subunit 4-domain-containing protein [Rhizophagus diaphanus]|nr:DNA polymerase delta, subunit 4-domain-containing protein [Rhizophagus diaphanus] [Rhizophagus sp. MUCL 43196]
MPKRKASDSSSKKLVQQKLTSIFTSTKNDKTVNEKDNPRKKFKQTIIEKEVVQPDVEAPHEDTATSVRQEGHVSSHQRILDDDSDDEIFEEVEALTYEDNSVLHEASNVESEPEELVEIQPKLNKLLHAFDLNYKFGPCIGLTRLERWERAHRIGLDPPEEVRDVLTSEAKNSELNECVFYGRV